MKTVGEVLHADVLLEATGRSKGCGIVEYANVEGANAAILGLQVRGS
jgi:RNA recognition motif-containing protein